MKLDRFWKRTEVPALTRHLGRPWIRQSAYLRPENAESLGKDLGAVLGQKCQWLVRLMGPGHLPRSQSFLRHRTILEVGSQKTVLLSFGCSNSKICSPKRVNGGFLQLPRWTVSPHNFPSRASSRANWSPISSPATAHLRLSLTVANPLTDS